MRLLADDVLDSVRSALSLLESENNDEQFFLYWVAAIVLLNTVDDVLKSQAKNEGWLESIVNPLINKMKKTKDPGDNIYEDFICTPRNRLVHHFEKGYIDQGVFVELINKKNIEPKVVLYPISDFYKPLDTFGFEGKDIRDLILESIVWWESLIATIKGELLSLGVNCLGKKLL